MNLKKFKKKKSLFALRTGKGLSSPGHSTEILPWFVVNLVMDGRNLGL